MWQRIRLSEPWQKPPEISVLPSRSQLLITIPGKDKIEQLKVTNDKVQALARLTSGKLLLVLLPKMLGMVVSQGESFDETFGSFQKEEATSDWFKISIACGSVDLELNYSTAFRAAAPAKIVGIREESHVVNIGEQVLLSAFRTKDLSESSGDAF